MRRGAPLAGEGRAKYPTRLRTRRGSTSAGAAPPRGALRRGDGAARPDPRLHAPGGGPAPSGGRLGGGAEAHGEVVVGHGWALVAPDGPGGALVGREQVRGQRAQGPGRAAGGRVVDHNVRGEGPPPQPLDGVAHDV